jgi:hypothetical protein
MQARITLIHLVLMLTWVELIEKKTVKYYLEYVRNFPLKREKKLNKSDFIHKFNSSSIFDLSCNLQLTRYIKNIINIKWINLQNIYVVATEWDERWQYVCIMWDEKYVRVQYRAQNSRKARIFTHWMSAERWKQNKTNWLFSIIYILLLLLLLLRSLLIVDRHETYTKKSVKMICSLFFYTMYLFHGMDDVKRAINFVLWNTF